MATIVVVGAGDIGGAAAREIAALDLVSRVVIVDDLANVAAGKALDVAQSAPVDRYHTALSATSDVAAVVGAVAVVLADVPGDERTIALVRRIAGLNQEAPLICAGVTHGAIIEKSVFEGGVSRFRVFGAAPEALRSAVVAMVSAEAGAAPSDITLSVLGRPPGHIIIPWDEASIAGRCATNVLTPPQIARLDARIARLWPPGPYTLAAAAARMLKTALTRSPRVQIALVAVATEEGMAGGSAMMPVTLNVKGIASLVPPALSARDRVRFETLMRA